MTIRSFTLITAVVLIGFGIFVYIDKKNTEIRHDKALPHAPSSTNKTSVQIPVQPKIRSLEIKPAPLAKTPTASIPTGNTPLNNTPLNNIVEFKIVEGLAVAYGDIILGIPSPDFSENKGMTEIRAPLLWERSEIPYLISSDLPEPARVRKALDYFTEHTPIRFIPYTNQADGIVFEKWKENCASIVGRVGGIQPIKLANTCQTQEIMHEIMHALGFVHEQSRPDRDQFVEILWQNIDPKFHPQFAQMPETLFEFIKNSPFDYHSIMLYEPTAFALEPGKTTMRSKNTNRITPAKLGLSEEDFKRINEVYRSR